MKTLKTILVILFFAIPVISFSQTSSSQSSETTYQRKTTRKTTTIGSASRADTIRKENSPVMEDDGTVNTTGNVVDGSRSMTGRPDADTLVNYAKKKMKSTTVEGGAILPDSSRNRKNRP